MQDRVRIESGYGYQKCITSSYRVAIFVEDSLLGVLGVAIVCIPDTNSEIMKANKSSMVSLT